MTVGSEVERAAVVETDRVLLEGPHSRTRELWLVLRALHESGRKDLISHVTEEGLASAAKTNVTSDAVVTPAPTPAPEEKHEKTIFDFPDKK